MYEYWTRIFKEVCMCMTDFKCSYSTVYLFIFYVDMRTISSSFYRFSIIKWRPLLNLNETGCIKRTKQTNLKALLKNTHRDKKKPLLCISFNLELTLELIGSFSHLCAKVGESSNPNTFVWICSHHEMLPFYSLVDWLVYNTVYPPVTFMPY